MDERHLRVAARLESIILRQTAMNSYRTTRQRAFTLVEIMIAVTIFVAVMIAIYSSWSAILRGRKIGQEAAVEAQRSRVAVRALENSLMSLQMFLANIKYDYFSADTSGDFAALSFVAHLAKSFPRSGDFGDQVVRRLTFTVEPGTNSENVLLLRQNPILFQTSADEDENPLVLARNVKEYTNRRTWSLASSRLRLFPFRWACKLQEDYSDHRIRQSSLLQSIRVSNPARFQNENC